MATWSETDDAALLNAFVVWYDTRINAIYPDLSVDKSLVPDAADVAAFMAERKAGKEQER